MKNALASLLSALVLASPVFSSNPGGVRFRGIESPIDERTSMSVRIPSCRDSMQVDFDCHIYDYHTTGYILRILTDKDRKDSPRISLYYEGDSRDHVFSLILEGKRFISKTKIERKMDTASDN